MASSTSNNDIIRSKCKYIIESVIIDLINDSIEFRYESSGLSIKRPVSLSEFVEILIDMLIEKLKSFVSKLTSTDIDMLANRNDSNKDGHYSYELHLECFNVLTSVIPPLSSMHQDSLDGFDYEYGSLLVEIAVLLSQN